MLDLRSDLGNLWRSAARVTSPKGARAIQFVAADEGEGTTSVAASFALIAAQQAARSAWLVDLDLRRNACFRGFSDGFAQGVAKPGRAFDASLGQEPPYSVAPAVADGSSGTKLLTAHQITGTKLLVTRFRNERLRQGQMVQLHTRASWWSALRQITDFIIVDTPSIDRASTALAVSSQMDGVVIVMGETTPVERATALRMEIEGHGGTILGIVMNRTRSDTRFANKFST